MINSPLRYPGEKAKLYPVFTQIIQANSLYDSVYCEPYAGGAGLALMLLTNGFVDRIALNDLDSTIYAFWWSILNEPSKFCKKIENTPVTIDEWHKQKKIWQKADIQNPVSLGFATYFLNRTNRSGIIDGAGPIGGFAQTGAWKIDVRFNKQRQISNIEMLSQFKEKISLSNLDALDFLKEKFKNPDAFVYLDPPYYVKGKNLYKDFYRHRDHEVIAEQLIKNRKKKWVVSYDDVPEIRQIYLKLDPITYSLNYSAGQKGVGSEVMYASDNIIVPDVFSTAAA